MGEGRDRRAKAPAPLQSLALGKGYKEAGGMISL